MKRVLTGLFMAVTVRALLAAGAAYAAEPAKPDKTVPQASAEPFGGDKIQGDEEATEQSEPAKGKMPIRPTTNRLSPMARSSSGSRLTEPSAFATGLGTTSGA